MESGRPLGNEDATQEKEEGSGQAPDPSVISAAEDDVLLPTTDFDEPVVGDTYDPDPDREKIRGRLAQLFAGLLAVMALAPILSVILDWATWDALEGPVSVTFGPIVGIVGTVLGFYFGSKRGGRR